ncbi:MAG: NADP-dependent succinic semialdehyde dehydrogenase [Bdellovibrionales bacterium RIFOXYD12_FULL_39_22]|nr:MAG: NADP-dependent succinic semialdehyde dehydrogenase [Bdellovibrionales bacterium RIFOXYB1_FULL_39_21]OFZ41829.1 MAG: NADP-dependent succinic semialdehyde dehydrogenase [Bdellovibrionales bacterium RIFOXYC12_FULL_39_17]OFZ50545.1 MAG: NADP-dependent succinic semialdehyde dehydrogenase [Bdellovibrionales bacterium RIFOXYC1_FULL_39_130]OFZ77768.1 MAG: NADP-dependent succinic semialdehyde dehydrogenase [Bdellovibrionales bacterium RIFOXYD1_FULL_39_84]OFZ93796.1 MAG: NADP-dependent succinic s
MDFYTINPTTGEKIKGYNYEPFASISKKLDAAQEAFSFWSKLPLAERSKHVKNLAQSLRKNIEAGAKAIVEEMGKTIGEAKGEIEKSAWLCEVYADKSAEWLSEETVQADGLMHKVRYEPLGVVLCIMPWNYPFWQAIRFAIPGIMAGNVSILKHSNNVPESALILEKIFSDAGFPKNVFQATITNHANVGKMIESPIIKGISLTGSTAVGMKVGEMAGKNLKKMVLELGGSDPFIVLDDADLPAAAKNAAQARLQNCGQSCIAGKRFIVMEKAAKEFSELLKIEMEKRITGDPTNPATQMGPLYALSAVKEVEEQVADAIRKGAKVLCGGKKMEGPGAFYPPTLITNVTMDMKVMTEEVFGPVAPIFIVKSEEEAIKIANSTEYGLGGCVWSKNLDRAERVAQKVECGSIFINAFTKSDPRMPFGGIKMSGLGRELSKYGAREFTNLKAYNIYKA